MLLTQLKHLLLLDACFRLFPFSTFAQSAVHRHVCPDCARTDRPPNKKRWIKLVSRHAHARMCQYIPVCIVLMFVAHPSASPYSSSLPDLLLRLYGSDTCLTVCDRLVLLCESCSHSVGSKFLSMDPYETRQLVESLTVVSRCEGCRHTARRRCEGARRLRIHRCEGSNATVGSSVHAEHTDSTASMEG